MNTRILSLEVQNYLEVHQKSDVTKIALAKPVFEGISNAELVTQITAKKKSASKLPTWFSHEQIYYPPLLSIEQCSSEPTAAYKADLAVGETLIDLTAGFGVDSFFFAKKVKEVVSCEINPELSAISEHNAKVLGSSNISFIAGDGIGYLKNSNQHFDTIYIDPARRNEQQKVFRLKDCTPDVTEHLSLFLEKAKRIIIKTAPLLDITAGLSELQNVSEIHIVSVKNECKELLWIIDKDFQDTPKVICASLNDHLKTFTFRLDELQAKAEIPVSLPSGYLYEPDVALLKSGAFNLISEKFELKKLAPQSQLYYSDKVKTEFPGRIFKIDSVLTTTELKKEKKLTGNVIVRNFPEKPENLAKKYKIESSHDDFIIFTKSGDQYIVIKARILQHY